MSQQPEHDAQFFDEATIPQASREVEQWRKDLQHTAPFRIVRWRVIDEVWNGQSAIDAVVLVEIKGQTDFGAAQGVGGVNALDLESGEERWANPARSAVVTAAGGAKRGDNWPEILFALAGHRPKAHKEASSTASKAP